MTSLSDLPVDLVGEMLSRAPLTSLSAVRSTCKSWNNTSEKQIFGKSARKQFLGFMLMHSRLFSVKFDGSFVDPSIKQVSLFDQVEIFRVYHCDGLLFCAGLRDNVRSVVVWNPYLGQTRWIQPINKFDKFDMFAFGYANNKMSRNHKILRFLDGFDGKDRLRWFELYSFNSNSWRVLHLNPDWTIMYHLRGVSLKGNTYLVAQDHQTVHVRRVGVFLLCFDFTSEIFGPRLPLPFRSFSPFSEIVTISCARDEQLALLYQHREAGLIFEFWTSTKIEPDAVSWTKFLKLDARWFFGFPANFFAGSFFIDEDKKVAVVSYLRHYKVTETSRYQAPSFIIGEHGYFNPLTIGSARKPDKSGYLNELVFCGPYVPSLAQIKINLLGKRKHRDY